MKNRRRLVLVSFLAVCVLAVAFAGTAEAKSAYLVSSHSSEQFDAWNINPDGTITYQTTHSLTCTNDPAGIGVYEWFGPDGAWDTADDIRAMFITSEFRVGFGIVDGTTLTEVGCVTAGLPDDLGGTDVDTPDPVTGDAHIFSMYRGTDDLYVFDWDASAMSATNRAGSPIQLPNCSGGVGLRMDQLAGVLYVADTFAGMVRGYTLDLTAMTAAEVMSYNPSAGPVDVAVDRIRGKLYTGAPDGGCAWGTGGASYDLSIYDLATQTEQVLNIGRGIMGIAVDEVTGYVYLTHGCYTDTASVWDPSTGTMIQETARLGAPAGIAIGNISYGLLNLSKDDGLGGSCVDAGASITYDICYDNIRNASGVTGVYLVDDLPANASFDSATDGGAYDSGAHAVTWALGNLVAGDVGDCVQLTVQVDSGAAPLSMVNNYATIDSDQTSVTTVVAQTEVCDEPPVVCDIVVPDDYPTIKLALKAASEGDEICVRDGVHTVKNLRWPAKNVTLRSENGPDNCIIDLAGNTGFLFYKVNASSTVIDGFTITNGYNGVWGSGIWCAGSSPTIQNCVITNCFGGIHGGGVLLLNSSATVKDCLIEGNVAGCNGGGIHMFRSSPTIDGCDIVNNVAGKKGGGVYCLYSTPTIINCNIQNNTPDDIYGCTP